MTGSPRRAYTTYFDSGYLARGLVLIDSLRAHGDHAEVWVLCLDEAAKAYLDELAEPGVHTLTLEDLEADTPELLDVKPGRSRMEYYFTCTPLLMRYVMNAQRDPGAVVIYLDADLYFFDAPDIVLEALGDGSVGIIEHRYPPRLERRLGKYGRFNVGWVGIRDDARGRACLDWWAASCLEWCFDTPIDGKYADQGYLDEFPRRFEGVVILEGAGLNLAPWNTARHRLTTSGSRVLADGMPVVFFHFHGVKRSGAWYVSSQLLYGSPMGAALRDQLYKPYLTRLEHATQVVAASDLIPRPTPAARGKGMRGLLFRAQRVGLDLVSRAFRGAVAVKDLPSIVGSRG